jgi:outer membrane protein OmpA-like peptidoglycan-associated protein
MFLKLVMMMSMAVVVTGGLSACATKGFVRTSVGDVNDKVEALGGSIEATQERTRQNEGRIGEVDAVARGAAQAAQQANTAAADATTAARMADSKVDDLDRASRRLVYEMVMSEDQGKFAFGGAALPDDVKARLDTLMTDMAADPQAAWFEIEGHTDNIGPQAVNDRIGLDRAEAAKRYLYEQHHVPLHKINVISFGAERPVAPNNTRDGRAQNRRIVIRVVA